MPDRRAVGRAATRRARVRAVRKAKITVSADAHAPFAGSIAGPDKDYRKEEEKRLNAEIAALEKELANFDKEKAAALVQKTLELELKRKRLRLEENRLEMTA